MVESLELEQVTALLPPVVLEMVELVGFDAVNLLVNKFGGTTFRFSDGVHYFPQLKQLIGQESAVILRRHFQAEHVYIPRCQTALRELRNQRFKAEFDWLTEQERLSKRMALLRLCPKYQFSDRQAWQILATANEINSQACLF